MISHREITLVGAETNALGARQGDAGESIQIGLLR